LFLSLRPKKEAKKMPRPDLSRVRALSEEEE
jgi:hypothetical protein